MARFKNNKEGILGLNFKGEQGVRTVQPGEVFEADKDAIPQHYFDQGWIAETKDEVGKLNPDAQGQPQNPQADARITNPKTQGPNPVQGSGTSMDKSETDKSAQHSGAYDAHTPGGQLVDDKSKKK